MVRDRFIDGQAECALCRHLDSLGPDTPMADIVDCCRVWESHIEVEIKQQSRTDRHPPRAVCQVTEDEQSPVESPETELLEDIIRKLLPPPPPEAAPIPSDQDLLIQRLMGASGGTGAIEIDRFGNHVAELASSRNSHRGGRRFADIVVGFRQGVFFVRGFDPYDGSMSDSRRVVSILAYGMAGGPHRRPVHSGTGASSRAPEPADGKRRLIRGSPGSVMTINPNSLSLGRTFQDRQSRVMWGLPVVRDGESMD